MSRGNVTIRELATMLFAPHGQYFEDENGIDRCHNCDQAWPCVSYSCGKGIVDLLDESPELERHPSDWADRRAVRDHAIGAVPSRP